MDDTMQETPAAEVNAELEAAKKQAAEYLDGWQRSRAEFANYKKRQENELSQLRSYATAVQLNSPSRADICCHVSTINQLDWTELFFSFLEYLIGPARVLREKRREP